MKKLLLILMTLAMAAHAESLCDMQIVMQFLEARYGKGRSVDDTPALRYDQPKFQVIVVYDPTDGRPWATDFYFVTKKTTFTKAEEQNISKIMAELPGTYSKESSAPELHFKLESYSSSAAART
jgi:hypothetical protein